MDILSDKNCVVADGTEQTTATDGKDNAKPVATSDRKRTAAIVGVGLLVMLLWGSLFPFVKYGYKIFEIDTSFYPNLILFAGVRFAISGALLSVFCVTTKRTFAVKQPKKLIGTALVAFFAVALHYTCTYIGLSMIDSGKTALLKQSGVVVFVCISFLFFKDDKFSWGKIAGAVLGVASVLVVNLDSFRFSFDLGSLLVIAASLCTVISNVVFKKQLSDVSAITVTGYSQLMGGVVLVALGLAFGGKFGTITRHGLVVMLYIIAATVVSYGLWYNVVQRYSLSKLFIIKMAEPLFAALISMLLPLNATLTWQHAVAFVLGGAAVDVSNVTFGKGNKVETATTAATENVNADKNDRNA